MKNVAQTMLLAITVLNVISIKAQTNDAKFITAVTVQKTDTKADVQGLKISYTYSFSPLGKQATIDSILKTTSFKIKTRIFIKEEAVNPGYGYSKLSNVRNDFEITSRLSGLDISNAKTGKQLTVFIPYAALKLPALASYTATVKAAFFSTVDITDKQVQLFEQGNITFYKPETLVATVYIDSIEVNTLDAKGRAWDYSFFGKDYPDIGVTILLADNILWDKHRNNNFLFVLKPNEKSYAFSISKNDKITILIQDRDLLIHDFIDQFECATADKIKAQWYPLIPNNNTLKNCKIQYSVN
jgi:hypothetical protein